MEGKRVAGVEPMYGAGQTKEPVCIKLSPEAKAMLRDLAEARRCSKQEMIERLIRGASDEAVMARYGINISD